MECVGRLEWFHSCGNADVMILYPAPAIIGRFPTCPAFIIPTMLSLLFRRDLASKSSLVPRRGYSSMRIGSCSRIAMCAQQIAAFKTALVLFQDRTTPQSEGCCNTHRSPFPLPAQARRGRDQLGQEQPRITDFPSAPCTSSTWLWLQPRFWLWRLR